MRGVVLILWVGLACSPDSSQGGAPGPVEEHIADGTRRVTIEALWGSDWSPIDYSIDTIFSPESPVPAPGFISRAALGSDDRLAMIDSLSQKVLVRHLGVESTWTEVVTEGDGPLEVRTPQGLWWMADTLVVFDGPRRRLLRLHAGAGAAQATPLPGTGSARALSDRGDPVFFLHDAFPDLFWEEGIHWSAVVVYLQRGDTVSPIGEWRARAWARSGPTALGLAPFGGRTLFAVSGDRLLVAERSREAVRILSREGEPVAAIHWKDRGNPVTETLRERLVAAAVRAAPAAQGAKARQILKDIPLPDSLPELSGMIAGDSIVILTRYRGEAVPGLRLDGFRELHRIVHLGAAVEVRALELPARAMPLAAQGDSLLLIRLEDELQRHGLATVRLQGGKP
jgi:hypothetical protein